MADSHTSTNTEEALEQSMTSQGESRSCHPDSGALRKFIGSDWGPRITKEVERYGAADYPPQRTAKAGEPFAGKHLVIPAGTYKVRNNNCTYRFRVYSAFACLSGLGDKREPGSVLILKPKENGSHETVLYFKPRTPRSTQEFYSDSQCGEPWVGVRPSLEGVRQEIGLRYVHIDTLPDVLAKDAGGVKLRVAHGVDASIEAIVNETREQAGLPFGEEARSTDEAFEERLSEIQLRKDAFELTELARVIEVIRAGFEGIMRVLPRAAGHHRGECIVEGAFRAVAYEEGDGLGYDAITVPGSHADALHWIDNDGPMNEGDLTLVDAGVRVDPFYTADITRTLLANGRFTEVQARVYQAVLDACEVALAQVNESETRFRGVHDAAMSVIVTRLREWGLLPVSAREPLSPADQQHRRWIPHGTSHRLGLDVHDCAQAYREMY